MTLSIFVWLPATNISSICRCRRRKVLCIARVHAPVFTLRRCDGYLRGCRMINLPGWRWATIKQVALDRLSRSLHSDVCDSDGFCDAVLHSTISGRGSRRERAALNISSWLHFFCVISLRLVCARCVFVTWLSQRRAEVVDHTFSAFWL